MKYVVALVLLAIAVAGYVYIKHDTPENSNPVTGLPWQIDQLAGGETRVFGITLGRTTLGEAIAQLGNVMKLAANFFNHRHGRSSDGIHREGREQEWQHRTDE